MSSFIKHLGSSMVLAVFLVIALGSEPDSLIDITSANECCLVTTKSFFRVVDIVVMDRTERVPLDGATVTYMIRRLDYKTDDFEPPCPCDEKQVNREVETVTTGPDGTIVIGEREWFLNAPGENVIIFASASKSGYTTDRGRIYFGYNSETVSIRKIQLNLLKRTEL